VRVSSTWSTTSARALTRERKRERESATHVLRKDRDGRVHGEAREEAVQAVGEDTALDARVEQGALDGLARRLGARRDVADGFHSERDVDGEHRQDGRAVDLEGESSG